MNTRVALLLLSTLAIGARGLSAQPEVRGMVYDSVAARVLAGATIQLVADSSRAARTTTSDALGRFTFADVPAGPYTIGFFHPALDSLALDPVLRSLLVAKEMVTVHLAIPSPATILRAVCGPAARGVVVGLVRAASDGAPVTGAEVRAAWSELRLTSAGVEGAKGQVRDSTGDGGWFALCGVPSPGTVDVVARTDADSAGTTIEMSEQGLARRDLFVAADTVRRMLLLSGTVTRAEGGAPVPDALVALRGGPETRADRAGTWSLESRAGTQTLEVRALGYYPVTRTVDLVPGVAAVTVQLFTTRAMLDTIRVTASRVTNEQRGFEERRRALGMGRFLAPEQITRRRPVRTSDLFTLVPGLLVQFEDSLGRMVSMPSQWADEPWNPGDRIGMRCHPVFYVNGALFRRLNVDDLDSVVDPEDIAGVEVYRAPHVPAQFSSGISDPCGSIVIWTKPPLPERPDTRRWAPLRAIAFLGGGLLAAYLIGLAF